MKGTKKTTEQWIKEAVEKHGDKYDYKESEYINSKTHIKIYCKQCKEFFNQIAGNHVYGKGCDKCSRNINSNARRFTTEQFIEHSKAKHGDKFDYSKVEYVNNYTHVILICNECKHEFRTIPSNNLNSFGCPKCVKKEHGKKLARSTDEFIKESKEVHGDKFSYEKVDYINDNTEVELHCNTCKSYFNQLPRSNIQGHGCKNCAIEKNRVENTHTTDYFIERSKLAHPNNEYDYSETEYTGNKYKVKIKCNTCGNIFQQTPGNHLASRGCPYCSSGRSERLCRIIFENLFDCKFDKCKLKCMEGLELDGYNKDLNLAFEYQGEQHYRFVPYIQKYYNKFVEQQERDKLKRELCIKNGINLVEVPFNFTYQNIKLMTAYICKKLEKFGYFFIFSKPNLYRYFMPLSLKKYGEVYIPPKEFKYLKTQNNIVGMLMELLKEIKTPILPLCDTFQKDFLNFITKCDTSISTNHGDNNFSVTANQSGRIFLNKFMLEIMITGYKPGKPSYKKCWYNLELREKLVRRMLKYDKSMNNGSLLGCYACEYGRLYNFPPNIAKALYNHFNAKKVLDPCAGYGGRLLGFWGSNAEEYVGIDPNIKIPYKKVIQQIKKLSNPEYTHKNVIIFNECAEDFDYTKISPVDFIFTSPPYFDLEIYSNENTQSCIKYPKFDIWIENFLFKMITKANTCLIKGGYFCINIKEYKTKNLIPRMIKHMESIGLTHLYDINLIQSKRYKNNKYEKIYIFTKK